MIHENDRRSFVHHKASDDNWMNQTITGRFWNGEIFNEYSMVPMGGTILRKVTFQIGLGA